MLYCALDPNKFDRISSCDLAKEIRDKSIVTYEGTNQVKDARITMYVHSYKLFQMKRNESISELFAKFTNIINNLKALGKTYTKVELVCKILRYFPKAWDAKVIIIIEDKDLTKMSLDELLGSLITPKMIIMEDHSRTKIKEGVALKSNISKFPNEEEKENESSSDSSSGKL